MRLDGLEKRLPPCVHRKRAWWRMSHFIQLASEYGVTVLLQTVLIVLSIRLLARPIGSTVYRVLKQNITMWKLTQQIWQPGGIFETLRVTSRMIWGYILLASSNRWQQKRRREYPSFYKGRQKVHSYYPQPDIVRIFDGCYQHIDELLLI